VPSVAPALGFDSVTVNPSSDSTTVSPETLSVIVFDVSPAAKLTVPLGSAPPTKSEADAGLAPLPVSDQDTLFAEPVSPVRVTVNVNGVVPDWPSALLALAAAIDSVGGPASSLRIVPRADAVPSVVPALGFDSVTVNPSSDSTTVSPETLSVIVFDVSPAAKLTVPLGSAPPTKSEADAGLAPLPVSDQDTLFAEPVSPVRVTVNVNGVVPDWPSALSAASAEIAKTANAGGVVIPLSQPLVSG
jgi:microcompartment protein CcmL/EutN